MNSTHPQVETYLRKATKWRQEIELLRMILLECGLDEDLKWGKPCYSFQNANVVIIIGFKEYCALGFFKGALLKDARGILVRPGENTRAGRQIRFTSAREIAALEPVLKAYIREAVEVEKAGLKVDLTAHPELEIPAELRQKMDENPALEAAFSALTPGRQRAYVMHFSQPKQSKTRESRIEKWTPSILRGKGLNDR